MALTSQSGASYLTVALPVGSLDGILRLIGLVFALTVPFRDAESVKNGPLASQEHPDGYPAAVN